MSLPESLVLPDIVELPSGLKLEALLTPPVLLTPPQSSKIPGKVAICLHPWSRLGGNMNDPVLRSLDHPLSSRLGFHVIRFNSRGVGRSSGWASLNGIQEVEDLKELVKYAVEKVGNVTDVALIGYSNGSLPASMHPLLPPPIRTSHILISYPFGPRGALTLFNSRAYQQGLENTLRSPGARVLLVYGDEDDFTSISSYDKWVDGLQKTAQQSCGPLTGTVANLSPVGLGSSSNPEKRLKVVPVKGATHFWMGSASRELLHHVVSFLEAL
ncbi:alpha/beta-hydrolase [Auriscalpium vulgare]|uniref:Alpha/beta-hydrolase n=1 Tax=Auriscalpium vulgare TaxID=40419 RepID=A0ACB8RR54_9AGAM|nr:alpha/beta-hydrolase [Auriscalpium vulgare]